jgi:hypothetical protein
LAQRVWNEGSAGIVKKASAKKLDDDLRPEYDLSQLKGGVRGKYYRQATARSKIVRSLGRIA